MRNRKLPLEGLRMRIIPERFLSYQISHRKNFKNILSTAKELVKSKKKLKKYLETGNEIKLIKLLIKRSALLRKVDLNYRNAVVTEFKTCLSLCEHSTTQKTLYAILATILWEYAGGETVFHLEDQYGSYSPFSEEDFFEDFFDGHLEELRTENLILHEGKIENLDELVFIEKLDLIDHYFELALEKSDELKQISSKHFKKILKGGKYAFELKPTVYDFFAHLALSFHKTHSRSIAYNFFSSSLEIPSLIDTKEEFLKVNVKELGLSSDPEKILLIYQSLTRLHLKSKNYKALAIIDCERLSYVNQHTNFLNYLQTIEKECEGNPKESWGDYYRYFKSEKTINEDYDELKKLLKGTLSAPFKFNIKQQLKRLDYPVLSFKMESIISVNTKSKILCEYENIKKLRVVIYRLNDKDKDRYYSSRFDYYLPFTKLPHKTFKQKLPYRKDRESHSTEIVIPPLAVGEYKIILLSAGIPRVLAFCDFRSSLYSVQNLIIENEVNTLLSNRITGEPLNDKQINYEAQSFFTDSNGVANLRTPTIGYSDTVTIIDDVQNETYKLDSISEEVPKETVIKKRVFLFTDRSLYRPSQRIFFKGVNLSQNGAFSFINKQQKVITRLYDSNKELIKEVITTSNDFGSFSGEVIIPNQVLNGELVLESYSEDEFLGRHTIFVEEYKLPKFNIQFIETKDNYKLNTKVSVFGEARALTGASLTHSKIKYSIKRENRDDYDEFELVEQGQTEVNEFGEFKIDFFAQENNSFLSHYEFKVFVEVLDINGESQNASTSIFAKKGGIDVLQEREEPFTASLKLHSKEWSTDENEQIVQIETAGNNKTSFVTGEIRVYRLMQPKRVFLKRNWAVPSDPILTREEFETDFPSENYNDENLNELETWSIEEQVFESSFNLLDFKSCEITGINKWKQGSYRLVFQYGIEASNTKEENIHVTVNDVHELLPTITSPLEINLDRKEYKPGDTAHVTIQSGLPEDLYLIVIIERYFDPKKIIHLHLTEKKPLEKIEVKVTESDYGGFGIKVVGLLHNKEIKESVIVAVPYEEKRLKIIPQVFRTILETGVEEEWVFQVKHKDEKLVDAEVLAYLYDASLDLLKSHKPSFNPLINRHYFGFVSTMHNYSLATLTSSSEIKYFVPSDKEKYIDYHLNNFGFFMANHQCYDSNGFILSKFYQDDCYEYEEEDDGYSTSDLMSNMSSLEPTPSKEPKPVRKKLNETAFFYPNLRTDENGEVRIKYETPEALSKWNLHLVAHTKDLKTDLYFSSVQTRKELMIVPNPPRFIRTGDQLSFKAKVTNLSEKELTGVADLELVNQLTGESLDSFIISERKPAFDLNPDGNTMVEWVLKIPKGNAIILQYTVSANTDSFSDAEQSSLPILSSKILLNESLSLRLNLDIEKTFDFEELNEENLAKRESHALTLEVCTNPIWYVVKALPYLMEFPYECAEQTFSRYFSHVLGQHILITNPSINSAVKEWGEGYIDSTRLEDNEELKNIALRETPWMRDSNNEKENQQRLTYLLDGKRTGRFQQETLFKLSEMQNTDGGWPWFTGGNTNRYITQYILVGFAHLQKMGVKTSDSIYEMINRAHEYLEREFMREYKLQKPVFKFTSKDKFSHEQMMYLYLDSLSPEGGHSESKVDDALEFYYSQAEKYWEGRSLYNKALIALTLFRKGRKEVAVEIANHLLKESSYNEIDGRFWEKKSNSYNWYESTQETQVVMIEAFEEILEVNEYVEQLKLWLINQRTNARWSSTKSTTLATYALTHYGSNWTQNQQVSIEVGQKVIKELKGDKESNLNQYGYLKSIIKAEDISTDCSSITIKKDCSSPVQGNAHWQYFVESKDVVNLGNSIHVTKTCFLRTSNKYGDALEEIEGGETLKLGDTVIVVLKIKCDVTLDYLHIKDSRGSGFEPKDIFSGYERRDGISYYKSIKDTSTHFFIDKLYAGNHEITYEIQVNNSGAFSNGICIVESMYAPEFNAHSNDLTINVN